MRVTAPRLPPRGFFLNSSDLPEAADGCCTPIDE